MAVSDERNIGIDSYEAFVAFQRDTSAERERMAAYEASLPSGERFFHSGCCVVCARPAEFLVDYLHCLTLPDGRRTPNWRERLVCPTCGLNNRMRAAVAKLLSTAGTDIYLTEAVTPLFQVVSARRPATLGSEYLRDGTPFGSSNAAGVRAENVTALSFADEVFDTIGTFNVLEHVPDYRRALAEFVRCLRPGGRLILTVPINLDAASTVTRASVDGNGAIVHHLAPEIHGDPLDPEGALAFYNFGWDFLDCLREAGFADPTLSFFWDPARGYMGGFQYLVLARKPGDQRTRPAAGVQGQDVGRSFYGWLRRLGIGRDKSR
jgi:SAM-dependent methyltransferase